jgi:hypothetical protein
MAKRFSGNLEWIDPKLLVTEGESSQVESFFLSLGVVFNDLKGLILFDAILTDSYEKIAIGEVTAHSGNYAGTRVQIQKLIASTINEFFKLLEGQYGILANSEFKEILNRLAKSDKKLWEEMFSAAHGERPSASGLLKTILYIRNNVAFHYDQSGKALTRAYISKFFGKADDATKEFAYYSIGDNMEETRFYFSDAAVEEALYLGAGKVFKEKSVGDPSFERYQAQANETVKKMNIAIASLIKKYIQFRRGHRQSM